MFSEDDLLPISALQHLLFCERQCALIHIERLWAENRFTVEGRHLHAKAHGEERGPRGGGLVESRPGVRIARGVALHSLRLGLYGVADVVEFHPHPGPLPERERESCAYPVEYKRGRPKKHDADRVQLCAQALCLEEMLGVDVPRGALFYGRTRRREEVELGATLRGRTEQAAARLHELIASGRTPTAVREPKCKRCSLLQLCLPEVTGPRRLVHQYVERAIVAITSGVDEDDDAGTDSHGFGCER